MILLVSKQVQEHPSRHKSEQLLAWISLRIGDKRKNKQTFEFECGAHSMRAHHLITIISKFISVLLSTLLRFDAFFYRQSKIAFLSNHVDNCYFLLPNSNGKELHRRHGGWQMNVVATLSCLTAPQIRTRLQFFSPFCLNSSVIPNQFVRYAIADFTGKQSCTLWGNRSVGSKQKRKNKEHKQRSL